jgi:hypothetical protein
MSMKNSSDTIEIRSRDLPVCTAVPELTAPPRAPGSFILRRNFLLQQVIEGKIKGGIEMTGRRGRRRRKLLDDFNEMRGYCHLEEEALDRTMWRARFGRGLVLNE